MLAVLSTHTLTSLVSVGSMLSQSIDVTKTLSLRAPLQGPTIFEALASVTRLRLKAGLSLEDSLYLFKWIYDIASTYRPEHENLEEAIERVVTER